MNQFFFNPNEQNTIAHHIFRNFEFPKFFDRDCAFLLFRNQFSKLCVISVWCPVRRNENPLDILDLDSLTFTVAEHVVKVSNTRTYSKFTRWVLTNLVEIWEFLRFFLLSLRLLSSCWSCGTFWRSCCGSGSLLTKGECALLA